MKHSKYQGLFPESLFDEASARALSKVGVVDVGSNSVRLVIFDGAARSPAYFFNEKIMCALGAGLSETGRLNPEGRERAVAALGRFAAIARALALPGLTVVATAAVRDAIDGPDFVEEVREETGLEIQVVSGPQEAGFSAQGVLLGWPGAYGLVCDIGGASMELAEIGDGEVGKTVSTTLAPLRLRTLKGGRKARKELIRDEIAALSQQLGRQSDRLFLVGGSWRALARLDMERRGYPLHVLHEYRMRRNDIAQTAQFIADHEMQELRERCGISSARMALVPYAVEVLRALVKEFKPYDIAISSYGIREGLLYDQMPQSLRNRDPLIEACRFAEKKDARIPGFGKMLFEFVMPLFSNANQDLTRLIKAACLLHDVSWRAHPDFRGEVCFDYATRANLGGLRHRERVFLGLAMLHRYRNRRDGSRFDALINLLDPDQIRLAEILGKAMRLGAMLWQEKGAAMAELQWKPRKRELKLRISAEAAPLYGEVTQARLRSLSDALMAEKTIIRLGSKLRTLS